MPDTALLKEYDFSHESNNEYEISHFFALVLSLMFLCIMMTNYVGNVRFFAYIPGAVVSLLVGIIAGLFCVIRSTNVTNSLLKFDPTIFFVALLPPIIFESGYSMKRRFFFQNFRSILTFAILGTIISALLTGIFLFMIGEFGLGLELSFAECLTFGSLISATDPVSTLAVLKKLHVDPKLYYIVFGESVLNDAVSIVLFKTFSKFIGYSHTVKSILIAMLQFALVGIGSTALGILLGCMSALVFKHFNFKQNYLHEISALLLFAYLPFLVAEMCYYSGIVAILFTSMVIKHYTYNNLSVQARNGCDKIFHLIAYMAETAVFLNLGLSVIALRMGYQVTFIAWTLLVILVARALHIYPLSCLLNCSRKEKIKRNEQHMIWFSGLRGAIAFALSLSFPGSHRDVIVTTTMAIVVISIFIFGSLTVPMLNCLKIKRLTPTEEKDLHRNTHPDREVTLLKFDKYYLHPFFIKPRIITDHAMSPGEGSSLVQEESPYSSTTEGEDDELESIPLSPPPDVL